MLFQISGTIRYNDVRNEDFVDKLREKRLPGYDHKIRADEDVLNDPKGRPKQHWLDTLELSTHISFHILFSNKCQVENVVTVKMKERYSLKV